MPFVALESTNALELLADQISNTVFAIEGSGPDGGVNAEVYTALLVHRILDIDPLFTYPPY